MFWSYHFPTSTEWLSLSGERMTTDDGSDVSTTDDSWLL